MIMSFHLMKARKMTFEQGPLLLQKYRILPERRKKNHIVTLKVHDRNREGLNEYVQKTCFIHSTMYYAERKICLQPISIAAIIIALSC